jgi:tetratricopeptide (TPR) repeat protein
MKNLLLILLTLPFSIYSQYSQVNCRAYLYLGDTAQYKACVLVEKVDSLFPDQFSRGFHEMYDEALQICPKFSYAYREKSTSYLKSGDFITWKKLIDKAVEYDWRANLGYRGWCRYQFFRDYEGAIKDLEKLDSLANYDIGYSQNGHYHLNIAKGMCYSAIGQKQKAIEIFQSQINTPNYEAGLFDYYQLGVTYFEIKDYQNALICFEKQAKINPLAETEYYRGKIYKILKNQIEEDKYKELAVKLYKENKNLFDPYTHHFNKVYLTEIEKE